MGAAVKTAQCAAPGHRPYRSKREAEAMLSWHLPSTCWKCRIGRTWRVFWCPCGAFHVGHGRYAE